MLDAWPQSDLGNPERRLVPQRALLALAEEEEKEVEEWGSRRRLLDLGDLPRDGAPVLSLFSPSHSCAKMPVDQHRLCNQESCMSCKYSHN